MILWPKIEMSYSILYKLQKAREQCPWRIYSMVCWGWKACYKSKENDRNKSRLKPQLYRSIRKKERSFHPDEEQRNIFAWKLQKGCKIMSAWILYLNGSTNNSKINFRISLYSKLNNFVTINSKRNSRVEFTILSII